jgi:hypothetical protein
MKIAFDLPTTTNNDVTDSASMVFHFLKSEFKNIKPQKPTDLTKWW